HTASGPLASLRRSSGAARHGYGGRHLLHTSTTTPLVSEKHGRREIDYFEESAAIVAREKNQHERKPLRVDLMLKSLFLPTGYPASVRQDYIHFQKWEVAKGIVSSAGFVGHLVGLGCLGMMLVAGAFGKFFDTETKRIRWAADCIHVAGVALELATPLFPAYFLPLASLANSAKGIAGLTTGATKAAINQGFALRDNLGDITAKGHSQGIVAYLMGMGIGIGTTYVTGGVLGALFAVYGVLAGGSTSSSGPFTTAAPVVAPEDVDERIILPAGDHFTPPTIVMGASLRDIVSSTSTTSSLFSSLFSRFSSSSSLTTSSSSTSSTSPTLLRDLIGLHRDERFVVRYARPSRGPGPGGRVLVVLHEEAGPEDMLRAYFTAFHLRRLASQDLDGGVGDKPEGERDAETSGLAWERASVAFTQAHYATFVGQLDARGWTRNVVLASGAYRARW
ncbi:uncharacterized protein ACA1_379390, partial [Acanthamoeba castellanii str. Neff]